MNYLKVGIIKNIIYLFLGGILLYLGFAEIIDSFWSGLGFALIFVGVLRLIYCFKLEKSPEYKERVKTEINDERNKFIRNKAWAWAGYLFILLSGICVVVFKIIGQDLLSLASSCAVCLVMILFWISYVVLKRKY